jgi:pimeloyl-ACP methyl ester carboxylesterase
MRREDATVAAARAHAAETVDATADLRALRDDPPALPDVPLTIVSGTRASRLERARREALVAAHAARAAAAPRGRYVTTPRAAHMVPFDDPEVVVREVERTLDLLDVPGRRKGAP